MLFSFLKYLQPTNYFSLKKYNGTTVFPDVKKLPESVLSQLELETNYISKQAQDYDLSWQALHKGYIGDIETIAYIEELHIVDNYIFIRKYFHKTWVFYVLIFRLLSLKNPFKEISSWFKTRYIQRSNYLDTPLQYDQWESFSSILVEQRLKVSVIIPTLNRYEYLKDVLLDLEQQNYSNFEVIIVDQSQPFLKEFYNEFNLDLKIEYQEEKAF